MNYIVKTTWSGSPESLVVDGKPFRSQFIHLPNLRTAELAQPGCVLTATKIDPSNTKIVCEVIFDTEDHATAFVREFNFTNADMLATIMDLDGLQKWISDHKILVSVEILPSEVPTTP